MGEPETVPDYLANGETVLRVVPPFRVVGEKTEGGGDPLWLKVLEQAVALVKAVAWPCLAIVLLIVFHRSLGEVAERLPDLVSQAQKISVGGLSMEIQAQAQRTGGAVLADVLKQLSSEDVAEVVEIGHKSWGVSGGGMGANSFTLPSEEKMAQLHRLEAAGLLETRIYQKPSSLSAIEDAFKHLGAKRVHEEIKGSRYFELDGSQGPADKDDLIHHSVYQLTPLGANAFDSILKAITEQLSRGKKDRE